MPVRTKAGQELQDGMLEHFIEQARSADANIERRIEREYFDVTTMIKPKTRTARKTEKTK